MSKAQQLIKRMTSINESLKQINESNDLSQDEWKKIVEKEYPNDNIVEVSDPEGSGDQGLMVVKNKNDGIQNAYALYWDKGNWNTKTKTVADGKLQS